MVLEQRKLVKVMRLIQAASKKGKLRVMGLFTAKMAINLRAILKMACLMEKIAMKDSPMAAPSLGFSHKDKKMGLVY